MPLETRGRVDMDGSDDALQGRKRLKVIFLPAWYPSEEKPVEGIFIKEHAKAASLHNDVVVIYAYPSLPTQYRKLCQVSEDIEDGIRTIRVRYRGFFNYVERVASKSKKKAKHPLSSTGSNKTVCILKRLLRIPLIMAGYVHYSWHVFVAFRGLVREGWRPDIIHAHVFSAGVPAVILGRIYKIPVVITEHFSAFPRRLLSFQDKIMARFAMNRAEVILPVSDYLRKHIEQYGIKNRFSIVPNVVNTGMFYPPTCRIGGKDAIKKILTVAALLPIKGIPFLLEAVGRIKSRNDFILDIVGDGQNRAEYEKIAVDLGLADIAEFHGMKPREEVAGFMRKCDFFVLPSIQETFGVVLIEALASGRPVVVASAGGPGEIMNEKAGLLVPPEDAGALAEAIARMLDNYQDYVPEEIAQYARDRFSYEAVGKKLEGIYSEVSKRTCIASSGKNRGKQHGRV